MTAERGPLNRFEVVWRNGHVDTVEAHQVSWHGGASFLSSQETPRRIHFHAELDGHWTLLLSALEDDIVTIRNVSHVNDLGLS